MRSHTHRGDVTVADDEDGLELLSVQVVMMIEVQVDQALAIGTVASLKMTLEL